MNDLAESQQEMTEFHCMETLRIIHLLIVKEKTRRNKKSKRRRRREGKHLPVAPTLEEVQSECVLGIDDPDEQEAIGLQLGHGQMLDVSVIQLAVTQGHPSRWVGGG